MPADGFYEWRRTGGPKQPYYLHPPEDAVLAMAGVWAVWKDPETGLWVPSAAVITTEANRMMSSIHDRMPVLLPREVWERSFKFAFVRNPWDRAVSLYEYRRGKDRTGIATRDLSFSEWTRRVFSEDPDPVFHNNPKSFQTQSEWLRDDRGEIDIDFVGRFERIAGDFEDIARKIAPGTSLRHLNASSRAAYGSYYDTASKETVTRWFEEDIERFGYVFEP